MCRDCHGLDQPIMSAEAVKGISGRHRGKANGIFMCGNDLSMILGSFSGALLRAFVEQAAFFIIAFAGLLCVSFATWSICFCAAGKSRLMGVL